ncbi:MAG: hypothetical protein FGF50_11155 [Candidatus Brockarchaeota archaeon]|nr:hypothetical protein [Candidatus Brockarchaeota archaeon]
MSRLFYGYTLAELLFRWKQVESVKHERKPNEVYVTDLVLCGYRLKMAEKFPELALTEVFNPVTLEGDIIHKGVQTVLKELLGDRVQVEVEGVKSVGSYTLKGRVDVIVDGEHGVEIKSARGDYGIGTHKHHELQAKIYKWMFNLESIELLYVTRDRTTSIPVEGNVTEKDVLELIEKPRLAEEEWICVYCPFNFACQHKLTGKTAREEVL